MEIIPCSALSCFFLSILSVVNFISTIEGETHLQSFVLPKQTGWWLKVTCEGYELSDQRTDLLLLTQSFTVWTEGLCRPPVCSSPWPPLIHSITSLFTQQTLIFFSKSTIFMWDASLPASSRYLQSFWIFQLWLRASNKCRSIRDLTWRLCWFRCANRSFLFYCRNSYKSFCI